MYLCTYTHTYYPHAHTYTHMHTQTHTYTQRWPHKPHTQSHELKLFIIPSRIPGMRVVTYSSAAYRGKARHRSFIPVVKSNCTPPERRNTSGDVATVSAWDRISTAAVYTVSSKKPPRNFNDIHVHGRGRVTPTGGKVSKASSAGGSTKNE